MNLFLYGTLLVPGIWDAVTDRPDIVRKPARLPSHRIRRVEGADFPAIVFDPSFVAPVPGQVALDLPEIVVARLDDYEDDFYHREPVEAETDEGCVLAQAYRVPETLASTILSDDPWTLEWFEEVALARYWDRLFP